MINRAAAPSFINSLLHHMMSHPFSISTDGSNDSGLTKMNPVTVRIYDVNYSNQVFILDMCTSTSGTAEALFNVIDSKMSSLLGESNPWLRCTSCGVDNTSVNIGVHNSLMTRIKAKNPSIFCSGCPCHILHNAAQKAGESFNSLMRFDVEEFVIDLFYWFSKSTKRKNDLKSYCDFCDQEYRSIIKHISVRWLSLEMAVERALKQLPSLTSYFLSIIMSFQAKLGLNELKQL